MISRNASAAPALAFLLALALSACGAPQKPPPPSVQAAPPPPAVALLAPPPAVPGEPPQRPRARDTLHKTAAELRQLFGEPQLIRREPPGEIWQYRSDAASCVLMIALYPADNNGGTLRANHAEAMPRRRDQPAMDATRDADCIDALLKKGKPVS